MHDRVLLQVLRVAEDAHEEVLGGDVDVQASANEQADEADTISNLLDGVTSTTERRRGNPFAAVAVDDQTEGEVGGGDDAHA